MKTEPRFKPCDHLDQLRPISCFVPLVIKLTTNVVKTPASIVDAIGVCVAGAGWAVSADQVCGMRV